MSILSFACGYIEYLLGKRARLVHAWQPAVGNCDLSSLNECLTRLPVADFALGGITQCESELKHS